MFSSKNIDLNNHDENEYLASPLFLDSYRGVTTSIRKLGKCSANKKLQSVMFEDDALSGESNVGMSNFNVSLNDREQSHALKSNVISESYHPLQNSLLKINSTLINL